WPLLGSGGAAVGISSRQMGGLSAGGGAVRARGAVLDSLALPDQDRFCHGAGTPPALVRSPRDHRGPPPPRPGPGGAPGRQAAAVYPGQSLAQQCRPLPAPGAAPCTPARPPAPPGWQADRTSTLPPPLAPPPPHGEHLWPARDRRCLRRG